MPSLKDFTIQRNNQSIFWLDIEIIKMGFLGKEFKNCGVFFVVFYHAHTLVTNYDGSSSSSVCQGLMAMEAHLGIYMWVFPERFKWKGKTQCDLGDTVLWTQDGHWVTWSKLAEQQHSLYSSCLMWTQWDQLPHTPAVPIFPEVCNELPAWLLVISWW